MRYTSKHRGGSKKPYKVNLLRPIFSPSATCKRIYEEGYSKGYSDGIEKGEEKGFNDGFRQCAGDKGAIVVNRWGLYVKQDDSLVSAISE